MKVLVTGTDGYIGSVMVPFLMKRGHEVVGLDTGFYRSGSLFDGYNGFKTQLSMDIRKIGLDDLRGFDACIDLAGLSNDALGQLNPDITYDINFRGAARLATLCKEAGVSRYIYSSSCSVYGIASQDIVDEESNPNPLTAYAKSKILVEQELVKLASDEFSPVMFRNATAFGVSPRMRFDIVLNNFAGHAWTSKIIKLKSDGSPERPMVHILDISQAFALALEMPRGVIHNQIINIGDTNQNYRVSEIAETISSVFPGCTVTYGKNDEDERSYRVSFKKISEVMPDFKCTINLEAGAMEFRKLFEEIHLSQEDFEFPAFTRLKQLKLLLQTEKINQDLYWRVQ